MQINIYTRAGSLRATVSPSEHDRHTRRLMGDNILNLSFTLAEYIPLAVGDRVDFEGERFTLPEDYKPEQRSESEYAYSCSFLGIQSQLRRAKVLQPASADTELSFSLDAKPVEHLRLVCDNVNRILGSKAWVVGEVPEAAARNIEYDNVCCFDALGRIAEEFQAEWWIEGLTVNLGRCEHGEPLMLGYGLGLQQLSRSSNDTAPFFTRLYPLGSTRNIDPAVYGHRRLRLPGGAAYVERNTHLGVVEQSEEAAFADIYPRSTGKVSRVVTEERTGDDGSPYTVYRFSDDGMDFDPNELAVAGLKMSVTFRSGDLAGRDFEVNYDSSSRLVEIVTQFPYENQQLPAPGLEPHPGDEYILYNIRMPQSYVSAAEHEFARAVDDYLARMSRDKSVYKASTDWIYLSEQGISLRVGRRVKLVGERLFGPDGHTTRVVSISRSLVNPADAEIEFSAEVDRGRIGLIENTLDKMQAAVRRQQSAEHVQILRSWDNSDPTDYNVFSSVRARRESLSRQRDDAASGRIALMKGATFGPYAGGLTGTGGRIDEAGAAELDSLALRRWLEVPELRYNRVEITMGDRWCAPGWGVVESVDTASRTATLRLEEGEPGAIAAGDLCMGIFHSTDPADNAAEDVDDGRGGRRMAGFATCYFRIVEVLDDNRSRFRYELRPVSDDYPRPFEPREAMKFVAYGSATDPSRRTSRYQTRTYERYLTGVDDWTLRADNIAAQLGDLSNLSVFGMRMSGYSAFLNNAYLTGRLQSADGRAVFDAARSELILYDPQTETGMLFRPGRGLVIGAHYDAGADSFEQTYDLAEMQEQVARLDSFVNTTVGGRLDELQAQLDGSVCSWFYPYVPSARNYPASLWLTQSVREQHVGDTFTNTQPFSDPQTTPDAGRSWRWEKTAGEPGKSAPGDAYGWTPIADSDASRALLAAAEAQDTADGKRRVFVEQPSAEQPYQPGDLWVNATAGSYVNELLRCVTAKNRGEAFDLSHWVLATKYTDDTLARQALERLEAMAADGVISREEKAALRSELARAASEMEAYRADAVLYGVSAKELEAAYASLRRTLTDTVRINDLSDTSLTDAQREEYNRSWAAYNAAVSRLLNQVSAHLAAEAADGVRLDTVNLIRRSERIVVEAGERTNAYAYIPLETMVAPGDEFALSIESIEVTAGQPARFTVCIFNDTHSERLVDNVLHLTESLRSGVMRIKADAAVQKARLLIYGGECGQTKGNTVVYNKVMLTRGNRPALSWSPAPQDVQEAITAAGAAAAETQESLEKIRELTDMVFHDGLVSMTEARVLRGIISSLESQRSRMKESYRDACRNELLDAAVKERLEKVFTRANADLGEVIELIRTAVESGNVSPEQSEQLERRIAETGELYRIYEAELRAALENIRNNGAAGLRIVEIDATALDQTLYYPVTIRLTTDNRSEIEVSSALGKSGVPGWATHPNGFTCECKWNSIGSDAGVISVRRYVEAFAYGWTTIGTPIGSIGQALHSSQEVIHVRGGGKYTVKATHCSDIILHTEDYISGQSILRPLPTVSRPTVDIDDARQKIRDMEYLKQAFADTSTEIDGGVVMSGFVGVKDSAGNAVAGMAGQRFDADPNGSLTGSPMIYAGAEKTAGRTATQRANFANFRLYPDGSLYALKGVFGGSLRTDFIRIEDSDAKRVSTNKYLLGTNTNVIAYSQMSTPIEVRLPDDPAFMGAVVNIFNPIYATTRIPMDWDNRTKVTAEYGTIYVAPGINGNDFAEPAGMREVYFNGGVLQFICTPDSASIDDGHVHWTCTNFPYDGGGGGTVNYVDVSSTEGLTVTGGPITYGGTISIALKRATASELGGVKTGALPSQVNRPLLLDASGKAYVALPGSIPRLNGTESTALRNFYAPETGGSAGSYLRARGTTLAPAWQAPDTAPVQGSTNLITSGAVYRALDGQVGNVSTLEPALTTIIVGGGRYFIRNSGYNISNTLGEDGFTIPDGMAIRRHMVNHTAARFAIRPRVLHEQNAAGAPVAVLETVIENYDSGEMELELMADYRMVYMRWRKSANKGREWHVPMWAWCSQKYMQGALPEDKTWWSITAREQPWWDGKYTVDQVENLVTESGTAPVLAGLNQGLQRTMFHSRHNQKMLVGAAIYRRVEGVGTYGWQRVSNIARVMLVANTYQRGTQRGYHIRCLDN